MLLQVRVTYRYDLHAGTGKGRRAAEYGNAGLLEPPACSLLVAFDAPATKHVLQQLDQVRMTDRNPPTLFFQALPSWLPSPEFSNGRSAPKT